MMADLTREEREDVILEAYGDLGVYTCDQLKAVGDMVAGRGDEKVYASHDGESLRFYLPLTDEMIEMESKQREKQRELRTATHQELDSIIPGLGDFTLGLEED